MARFFAFFGTRFKGMAPSGGEANQGGGMSSGEDREIADVVHEWYGKQAESNPRYAEFLKARGETSHKSIMSEGDRFNYKEMDRGGKVLHEEVDQHTGNIEQTVQVSSQTDSGTRKLTWAPTGPRTMQQISDKRTD